MLLSLISVLVLLVIAFFALWVGVVGRISGAESPELSLPARGLAGVVALLAFGGAYAVYQHPMDRSAVVASAPAAAAMPSSPPETRGLPVREAGEPIATPADEADAEVPSTEAVMAPEPGLAAEAEAEAEEDTPPAAPPPRVVAAAASAPGAEALSPSAAALEQRASAPRRAAPAWQPLEEPAADAPTNETPAAPRAGASTPVATGTAALVPTKRSRRNPLLLHVHNTLGPDQQREQLTLRIEGKTVAQLAVDPANPKTAVSLALPRPGLLHYRLEGYSEATGRTELMGHGCIKVRDGSRYTVRRTGDGQRVSLVPMGKAG